MKQHRIDRLVEAWSLEPVPAEDAEVAAIWAAALREWSDASVPGLSVAGAYTHAYQAALRAATAMLRGSGYRIRGAVGSHHHATFYAVGALGDDLLERISDGMQSVRGGRHAALYGDEDDLEPEDLARAMVHAGQLLEAVHRWLRETRPNLGDLIAAPPGSSFPGERPSI